MKTQLITPAMDFTAPSGATVVLTTLSVEELNRFREHVRRNIARDDARRDGLDAPTLEHLARAARETTMEASVLLEDHEWGKWSDREIARRTGVGHPFVASVRSSLESDSSEKPTERTFTTKHCTTATMKTANIGSRPPIEKTQTVFDGDTGAVIDNPMVETNSTKPFHSPPRDDSQDTGIGPVHRPTKQSDEGSATFARVPTKQDKLNDLFQRLDAALGRPSWQQSLVAIQAIVAELKQIVL